MSDDLKEKIQAAMKKSSDKGKKKLYVKDVCKLLPDEDKKQVKNMIKGMVDSGDLKYWSSGSTTYVVLPEDFENMA